MNILDVVPESHGQRLSMTNNVHLGIGAAEILQIGLPTLICPQISLCTVQLFISIAKVVLTMKLVESNLEN